MKAIFAKTTDKFIVQGRLSDDKMKLFVDVLPSGREPVTRDELTAVIREFAPKADLHEGVLEDIAKHVSKGEKAEERRVSRGTPAIDGADGKPLLLVKKMTQDAEIKVDNRGFADYMHLHLFDNVSKGQIVARVYPPKAGTDGTDALGNKVASKPGKPFKLSLDKTLALKDTGGDADKSYQVVEALDDGYLAEDNGRLLVKTELYIKDNLDFRYGNIDFIGSVKVSGDVMPGFNITAKKGIEVLGSVRGGSLICMDGDIKVKGYVYGGRSSRVISGRSFTATVVQEINAEIIGDINILKESIDSNLRTESSLYVKGGQIVGGESYAVCGVEAKFLGNKAGQATNLNLCSNVETRTEYARLVAAIDSHLKAEKLIEVHLGPLVNNPARIQLLNPPHREKMQKLLAKHSEINQSRIKLMAKKKEMLENARTNDVLRVNYLSMFYEGVVLRAGEDIFTVNAGMKGPGSVDYISAEHRFVTGDYKALECNINSAERQGDKNE